MKEGFENIDQLFKDELSDFSPTPPEGAWENIENRLNTKESKRVLLPLYKIVAGLALLISIGSVGVYLFKTQPNSITTETSLNTIEEPDKGSTQDIIPAEKQVILQDSKESDFEVSGTINNLPKSIDTEKSSSLSSSSSSYISAESTSDREVVALNTITPLEASIKNATTKEEINYEFEKRDYSDEITAFFEEDEIIEEEVSLNSDIDERWSLGGQAGPQYSYRQISSNSSSQDYLKTYNQGESGMLAYAGGVNVAYKPAKRLSIQSGIYYSKMGQTSEAQPIYRSNDLMSDPLIPSNNYNVANVEPAPELRVSSSLGDVSRPEPTVKERNIASNNEYSDVTHVDQYMEYLEIPIVARYAVIDRKFGVHLLGGLSTNFLVESPVYLSNGDYYTSNNNLEKINYSSTVGFGLGYKFAPNLSFSLEPQFKYYLNKVNSSSNTDVHPYSFGIFTGINYLF